MIDHRLDTAVYASVNFLEVSREVEAMVALVAQMYTIHTQYPAGQEMH